MTKFKIVVYAYILRTTPAECSREILRIISPYLFRTVFVMTQYYKCFFFLPNISRSLKILIYSDTPDGRVRSINGSFSYHFNNLLNLYFVYIDRYPTDVRHDDSCYRRIRLIMIALLDRVPITTLLMVFLSTNRIGKNNSKTSSRRNEKIHIQWGYPMEYHWITVYGFSPEIRFILQIKNRFICAENN